MRSRRGGRYYLDGVWKDHSLGQPDKGDNWDSDVVEGAHQDDTPLGACLHAGQDVLLPRLHHIIKGVVPLEALEGALGAAPLQIVMTIHVKLQNKIRTCPEKTKHEK